MKYPKINSLYKRDVKGTIILNNFSSPAFEELKEAKWNWYEKIDGTNIRVFCDGNKFYFKGRTEKSKIPSFLKSALDLKFNNSQFIEIFKNTIKDNIDNIILFGEGYGNKIQSVGRLYSNTNDFILFDIAINNKIIRKEILTDISNKLNLTQVPLIFKGTISEAESIVKEGFNSKISNKPLIAEGLVGVPINEYKEYNGNRIIVKLKHKDYKKI